MNLTRLLQFNAIAIILISSTIALNAQEISTRGEIYSYEVGDIFHNSSIGLSSGYGGGGVGLYYFNKKILGKQLSVNEDSVTYILEQVRKWASSPMFNWDYNYDTITTVIANLDALVHAGNIDSVYVDPDQYNGRVINYKFTNGYFDETFKFVNGCGRAFYRSEYSDPYVTSELTESLLYYKKGLEEWGTPIYLVIPTFVNPQTTWNVARTFPNANPQNPSFVETSTRLYGIIEDSIVNGKKWWKYYSSPDENFETNFAYEGIVRDQNGIVFFMDSTGVSDTLYNFNLEVGDSVLYNFDFGDQYLHVEDIDVVYINTNTSVNEYYKRFHFETIEYPPFELNEVWIENIGSVHGPLFPKYPKTFSDEIPDSLNLTCYKVANLTVWNNENYDECYVSIILDSEEKNVSTFDIYPNPAKDFIQISTPKNEPFTAEILSLSGSVLKTIKCGGRSTVNISQLKPGIYILKIEQEGQQIFKKLIKE